MNAAARALEQGCLFRGSVKSFSVSRETIGIIILVVAVLVSALAVVYAKNSQRRLFSELQVAQQQSSQLKVEYGQLLLEQSTWATPSRVQRVAQERYDMVMPNNGNVVMIKL